MLPNKSARRRRGPIIQPDLFDAPARAAPSPAQLANAHGHSRRYLEVGQAGARVARR